MQISLSARKLHAEVDEIKLPNCYSDYKKMFESKDFVDFLLKSSDGKLFDLHKVVISARSPVFYAMLRSNMEESKKNFAFVPDFDSTTMKEVLRFIYYNHVENLPEIATELIYAAEKYQLDELKEICVKTIIATLSTNNVIDALIISDRVSNMNGLFEKCFDLIVR